MERAAEVGQAPAPLGLEADGDTNVARMNAV